MVGHSDRTVRLGAAASVRIEARFAGHGRCLASKHNFESRRTGVRRAFGMAEGH